jgi:hypothetical protein
MAQLKILPLNIKRFQESKNSNVQTKDNYALETILEYYFLFK